MLIRSRTVRGRCPICGGEHAACGTPSESTPVDERMEVAAVGVPLKRYTVTTPSGVETMMKLNEDDAKRLGVLDQPKTTSTQTGDPETAVETTTETPAKSRTAANKSRSARTKGDGD